MWINLHFPVRREKNIYFILIVFFIVFFFTSITIKLYNHLITNVSGENSYFYHINCIKNNCIINIIQIIVLTIINCIKNNEIFLCLNRLFVLAVARTYSVKRFLVISQNLQKNTCSRVTFWISLLKKRI